MATVGGKIAYVGNEAGARKWEYMNGVKLVDLQGYTVLPGKFYIRSQYFLPNL
jgi:predicted amidohydrolase YtcJ